MKTFLVRIMMHTKRPGDTLGKEAGRHLKGDDAGGFISFQELRETAHEPALRDGFWSFTVLTVVVQSRRTREDLERRLLNFRNQSDPKNSRVKTLELPELVAARFWAHAKSDSAGAVAKLKEFFPWNAGVGSAAGQA